MAFSHLVPKNKASQAKETDQTQREPEAAVGGRDFKKPSSDKV